MCLTSIFRKVPLFPSLILMPFHRQEEKAKISGFVSNIFSITWQRESFSFLWLWCCNESWIVVRGNVRSLGGYESPWGAGGALPKAGEIMTRRWNWKPFLGSWWSLLPLGQNWHLLSSSAPLQVHRDRGNPLIIVLLHGLTILYYYLLIPPALLITILFHVCPRGLVSFRVEEGGNWANSLWRI